MQTWTVAKARNSFAELYHAVTDEWNEIFVEHGSRKNAKKMSLVPTDLLDVMIDKNYKFTTEWTFTRDDTAPQGWWTAWVPQFGLYGDGPNKETALHSLAEAVVDEVSVVMQDVRGYFSSQDDFINRYPYFRRIFKLIKPDGSVNMDEVIATLTENERDTNGE